MPPKNISTSQSIRHTLTNYKVLILILFCLAAAIALHSYKGNLLGNHQIDSKYSKYAVTGTSQNADSQFFTKLEKLPHLTYNTNKEYFGIPNAQKDFTLFESIRNRDIESSSDSGEYQAENKSHASNHVPHSEKIIAKDVDNLSLAQQTQRSDINTRSVEFKKASKTVSDTDFQRPALQRSSNGNPPSVYPVSHSTSENKNAIANDSKKLNVLNLDKREIEKLVIKGMMLGINIEPSDKIGIFGLQAMFSEPQNKNSEN